MKRRVAALILVLAIMAGVYPLQANGITRVETPDYKVAFYPFDCYHMMDENGKRSGYGYEMMQGLSGYLQCTFSYVGYDKTAKECEELLRSGGLDIYTAAKHTPERDAEFAFTTHPAITSYTCMNVKVGNRRIVSGDYSTYNGMRVGLLRRHTYNGAFLDFMQEKGFTCDIIYYETPTELTNALVDGDVDALVNSYIRIPEDERTIENFGETPYYIMVRKEDQALAEKIDAAFDRMNVEQPNWRTDLYNAYYGSVPQTREFTQEEKILLNRLRSKNEVVRGVMNPEGAPYSWYADGEAMGIAADIFRETADRLELPCEILPVSTKEEYEQAIASGSVDVWMDMDSGYEDETGCKYKLTQPYLVTSVSILRTRSSTDKVEKLVAIDGSIAMKNITAAVWPEAELKVVGSQEECKRMLLNGQADGALLMSYTAQRIAQEDVQNRLRVSVVPSATLELRMGINADDSYLFFGLWQRTLAAVAEDVSAQYVQEYVEKTGEPSVAGYLYDHPTLLIFLVVSVLLLLVMAALYAQSVSSKKRQEKIAEQLAAALKKAEEATAMKDNFFSKMSHDIRTPLNVVLGMTQIAQRYRNDQVKLESALTNITKEGSYLLTLINSILDVNQLEHGVVELQQAPFNPAQCLEESAEILSPLFGKKEQKLTVCCDSHDRVVLGDENRLRQILINIISNASKYTEMGGHIALSLECLPGDRYRFTCRDDGIGMSPEFVKHICEDYARAEDSRVSKTQGTGLGMAVVKGFTERMGGTLHIDSALGKGSVFRVELPFPPASDREREAVLRPVSGRERPDFVGKKVLLVEDNALNAEIAMELLQSVGLQVDWAENGQVGVRHYQATAPGELLAVFMDMQMPVMDGVTATKQIRRCGRPDSNVPIFAMTANTFAADRRVCREAGMNGFIPKPVSIKSIMDALYTI